VIRGNRHSGGGEYLVLAGLAFFPWRLLPAFLILGLLISPFVDVPTAEQKAARNAATRARIELTVQRHHVHCDFQDWRQGAGPKLNGPMGGRTPLAVTGYRMVGLEILFRFEGEDYSFPDRLPELLRK
tara:strand:- start:60844 stop:61227 length:384 start_codon:yes stop_codon:yes gene_type:complete